MYLKNLYRFSVVSIARCSCRHVKKNKFSSKAALYLHKYYTYRLHLQLVNTYSYHSNKCFKEREGCTLAQVYGLNCKKYSLYYCTDYLLISCKYANSYQYHLSFYVIIVHVKCIALSVLIEHGQIFHNNYNTMNVFQ